MARLLIPEDFANQLTLLNNIITKNTALGAASPLPAFLTQQNIDLDDDLTAGNSAATHETSRALLSKQSENFNQLRDNRFNLPWKHVTGGVQFLKSFYRGNTAELGNWGITITGSNKVTYPAAFTSRLAIVNTFIEKHDSYAAGTSPLQPYLTEQGIDLAADLTLADNADGDNTNAIDTSHESENETELRDNLWNPVLAHIRAIGNFLMRLNRGNEKAVGLWGFVVDDSPQAPKLRTTKQMLSETKTNKAVVIGSVDGKYTVLCYQ